MIYYSSLLPKKELTSNMNSHEGRILAFLQVNLGRDRAAMDLLEHISAEKGIDIAVIAEPNKNYVKNKKCLVDEREDVALWVRIPNAQKR